MVGEQTDNKTNIGWVVLPVMMCLGVVFYHFHWLFVFLGLFAATACFFIAKREQWKESARITGCVSMVALTYMIAGGYVGGQAVVEANNSNQTPLVNLNDEADRMKVFDMAMRLKAAVDKGERDVNEALKSDARNYEFLKSRLASRKASHKERLQFTAKYYHLSDDQFTRIINEGIAEDWPY